MMTKKSLIHFLFKRKEKYKEKIICGFYGITFPEILIFYTVFKLKCERMYNYIFRGRTPVSKWHY